MINSSLAHAPPRRSPQSLCRNAVSKVNPGPHLLQYFCFHNFFFFSPHSFSSPFFSLVFASVYFTPPLLPAIHFVSAPVQPPQFSGGSHKHTYTHTRADNNTISSLGPPTFTAPDRRVRLCLFFQGFCFLTFDMGRCYVSSPPPIHLPRCFSYPIRHEEEAREEKRKKVKGRRASGDERRRQRQTGRLDRRGSED